ncbi:MAG: DUF1028 domain-containing protein [Bacteroidales bacterium]
MKLILFLFIVCLILDNSVCGQDTFSIVAVDSVTGEIGSAGASCVGYTITYPHGAQIISDVIPGIGAIHTQSYWLAANQANAHNRMIAGDTPQQIIDWLEANDAQNNPHIRQYGIVSYNNGHPLAAGYTGANCFDYKNDTSHLFYSIQGNILLGQMVIDSIQNRFLSTPGSLAERLMAALQGAKMIGADTRCASPYLASSMSAFVRVAKPTDIPGNFYLDLWMSYPQNWSAGPFPVDPIDSLQTLFNNWVTWMSAQEHDRYETIEATVYQDIAKNPVCILSGEMIPVDLELTIYDVAGKLVFSQKITEKKTTLHLVNPLKNGVYFFSLTGNKNVKQSSGKFFIN